LLRIKKYTKKYSQETLHFLEAKLKVDIVVLVSKVPLTVQQIGLLVDNAITMPKNSFSSAEYCKYIYSKVFLILSPVMLGTVFIKNYRQQFG
jgi:hypothetical protein